MLFTYLLAHHPLHQSIQLHDVTFDKGGTIQWWIQWHTPHQMPNYATCPAPLPCPCHSNFKLCCQHLPIHNNNACFTTPPFDPHWLEDTLQVWQCVVLSQGLTGKASCMLLSWQFEAARGGDPCIFGSQVWGKIRQWYLWWVPDCNSCWGWELIYGAVMWYWRDGEGPLHNAGCHCPVLPDQIHI